MKAKGLLARECTRKLIYPEHKLVRFLPNQQIAKRLRRWPREGYNPSGVHGSMLQSI
jgi:hypothetical protein